MDTNYVNGTVNGDASFKASSVRTDASSYGMKWHKFLVNFSLWLGAALNAALGVVFMADGVPFYGLVLLYAAVYTIFVRFQLANFKVNAYKHLLFPQLIVVFAELILAGVNIASIAPSIAACSVNYLYYNKRDSLFVN